MFSRSHISDWTSSRSRRARYSFSAPLTLVGAGLVLVAVAFSACGSGNRRDIVVRVGDHAITGAQLAHWTTVEAVLAYEVQPHAPVPSGVVPDPPSYAACIEFARTKAFQPEPRAPQDQLKRKCEQRYEHARTHVLNILITFLWLADECAKRHVTVTTNEVNQALQRIERNKFGGSRQFHDYLRYTTLTLSDELLRIRMNMLAMKLQSAMTPNRGSLVERERAVGRFLRAFPTRWAAKTKCSAGYVIPECAEYKGPLSSESAI